MLRAPCHVENQLPQDTPPFQQQYLLSLRIYIGPFVYTLCTLLLTTSSCQSIAGRRDLFVFLLSGP